MAPSSWELAELSYEGFRTNDLEALLAIYHPELTISFEHWDGFPESTVFRGHDGLADLVGMLGGVFGELAPQLIEMEEIGDERVLATATLVGLGKASGAAVDVRIWQIVGLRDGLICEVDTYTDEGVARRDAGLTDA